MAKKRTWWRVMAQALLVALVATACGDGGDVLTEPEFTPQTLVIGSLTGWSADNEDALESLLEQEKQRLDRERSRSEVGYDALKLEWDRFRHGGYDKTDSPLLVCDPLQYAGETKIIGPEGGDISMGPHRLRIPKGALTSYTVITGESLASLHVQVAFSPHGLRFRKAPVLMLSYEHCYRPRDFDPVVVYMDDFGRILEWLSGFSQPQSGEFFTWIDHFSKYAMASN